MWLKSVRVRSFYLTHLCRPASYRPIYRAIRESGLRRIVELGVANSDQSLRLIEMAAASDGADHVVYTGIDLFELRGPQDGPGLSLKMAHRSLVASGAKIRLLPGDPYSALSRAANMLGLADLVVIGGDQNRDALLRAWFYIERLLQARSQVFLQEPGARGQEEAFRQVPHDEIRRLAAVAAPRRRAA